MAVKRLLAIVAAVAMVAGALVFRQFLDDGGDLSLGGARSTIFCDQALADACAETFGSADLTIEAPGKTLDRLLDDTDDGPVVWIAADLWFDILDSERTRLNRGAAATDTSDPLAHTSSVLFGDVCDPAAWACFRSLDSATDVGLDSLDSSSGMAAYSQIVAAELGTQQFAANDFSSAFDEWRRTLRGQTTFSPQPVIDIFLTRPGTYDLIATTMAEASDLGRGDTALVPAEDGPDLQIRAVAFDDARLPGALDDLGDALVDLGWDDGAATDSERPSGGAMQALRQ